MEYTPISPFMRPISHAQLRAVELPNTTVPGKPVNKWEILRELSKAQAVFGITDRDLTTLQGLLSFYPNDCLGAELDMIIFPSNKAICERLNGMACSTMRRHVARLIDAGLLIRRDSPNGKRYVRRGGGEAVAFGFDISPLFRRSEEIFRAATAVREAEDHTRRLRENVSLMRRDLAALAEYGETRRPSFDLWHKLKEAASLTARALRRKLSQEDLTQLRQQLETFLDQARDVIDGTESQEMSTVDAQNEHHHQSSKKEYLESEKQIPIPNATKYAKQVREVAHRQASDIKPRISLRMVTEACTALKTYYSEDVRHWHQLFDVACHIRPAMGISEAVWRDAIRCMGAEQASVVVAAMLERFSEIRSPNAYLRSLAMKAEKGAFTCGPMVLALFDRRTAA